MKQQDSRHRALHLRRTAPADHGACTALLGAAFGRPQLATAATLVRTRGQELLSIAALLDDEIVGYLQASPMDIDPPLRGRFAGIVPVAVSPEHQGRGIGSALVEEAIAEARRLGLSGLFVLGRPAFYRRFGFVRSPLDNELGATISFMQRELKPGALAGAHGLARYVSAFKEVGA